MTLPSLRAALRQDLHDEDAAAYRWTDAALDRHIRRALQEYQLAYPLDAEASIPALDGTLRYSLGALSGLLYAERLWYPYDVALAPVWLPFRVEGGYLYLPESAGPTAGTTIRVFFAKAHTVDASQSTVPVEHELVVLAGAAAAALADASFHATNRVNLSRFTPRELHQLHRAQLAHFHDHLARLRLLRAARGPSTVAWTFHDSNLHPIE